MIALTEYSAKWGKPRQIMGDFKKALIVLFLVYSKYNLRFLNRHSDVENKNT
jgi:hypothetical protein